MVGLERMLAYRGVDLARFHCINIRTYVSIHWKVSRNTMLVRIWLDLHTYDYYPQSVLSREVLLYRTPSTDPKVSSIERFCCTWPASYWSCLLYAETPTLFSSSQHFLFYWYSCLVVVYAWLSPEMRLLLCYALCVGGWVSFSVSVQTSCTYPNVTRSLVGNFLLWALILAFLWQVLL